MLNQPIRIGLVLCMFLVAMGAQAQNNNSKYFDQSGAPDMANLIKLELSYLIIRDIGLFYERVLNNRISMEVGTSLLLEKSRPGIFVRADEDKLDDGVDGGFSWYFSPRYYLSGTAPEGSYLGLQYRGRNYDIKSIGYSESSFFFTFGFQENTKGRFVWDSFGGVGPHMEKGTDPGSTYKLNAWAFTGGLRVSYYF